MPHGIRSQIHEILSSEEQMADVDVSNAKNSIQPLRIFTDVGDS
jgi:hypothetical protein